MTNFTAGVVLLVCVIIYVSASSSSRSVFLNIDDLSFTRGFKLVSDVFYVFEPVGVLQCMRECKLRSKCRIIGWSSQKCQLGENETAKAPTTNRNDWVSQPETWSHSTVGSIMGTCDLHTCPNGKKCIQRSNGLSICITSECPEPPIIRSAMTPTGIRTVNSQFSYVCVDRSMGTGNPSITCKPDGTWTPSSFSCQSGTETTESTTKTTAVQEQEDTTTIAATKQEDTATTAATKQENTTTTAATKQEDTTTTAATKQEDTTAIATTKQEDTATTAATKQEDTTATATTKQEDTTTTAATKQEDTTATATTKQEDTATTAAKKQEDTTTTAAKKQEDTTTTAAKKQEDTTTTATLKQESSAARSTLNTDRVSRSASGSLTTKQPRCKASYTTVTSQSTTVCYKMYKDVADTYDGAKTRCAADGANLMIIRSKDKINAIEKGNGDMFKGTDYFIDGSDVLNEGVWKYSDGSLVTMSMFKKSPKDDTSKNCLTVKKDKKFYEDDCSNSNAFICEILVYRRCAVVK